ncbi:hypothetical protein AB1Y20_016322 [Prymnesium parvum]|uniref:POTRA domain-containing protein n=1 Tax=Prymnesium parvum TaxID=97485 RepID=A0AB34ICD8_PRYPA
MLLLALAAICGRSHAPQERQTALIVRSVSVNSRVIPAAVLRSCARHSGVLDSSGATPEAMESLAARINSWYREQGYLFSRVTSRRAEGTKLTLVVSEPCVASQAVALHFLAPAATPRVETLVPQTSAPQATRGGVPRWWRERRAALSLQLALLSPPIPQLRPDPQQAEAALSEALQAATRAGVGGEAMRKAEEELVRLRKAAGVSPPSLLERAEQEGAVVKVGGSTRTAVISQALGLRAGAPFRWDAARWQKLQASGLFEVAEAKAKLLPKEAAGGGDVQLHVRVVEKESRPGQQARHMQVEPGVSLSQGHISGELALSDHNLGGRNQQLRLDLSLQNSSSFRASFQDPRLGRRSVPPT